MAKSRYQQASSGFLPVYGASKGRQVIEAEVADVAIRPVATATDPYTRVSVTPKSPLFALADALKEFEGSLGGLARKQEAENAENDRIRGEAAFLAGTGPEHAQAVEQGLIFPQQSPHFLNAYKEAEGRHIAREATSGLASDYDTWEGKDSDETGEAFTAWSQERIAARLEGITDPRVLKGMLPALRQSQAMLHKRHQEYVAEKTMERGIKGISTDVQGAIESATAVPIIANGRNRSYELVHQSIRGAVDHANSVGIPRHAAEQAAADTVIAQAIARRDVDLLDALPSELSANPKIAKAAAQARDSIAAKVYQDEQRADAALAKRTKEVQNESYRAAIDILSTDVNAEMPEALLQAGTEGDPQFRVKVEDLREKMRKHHTRVPDEQQNAAQLRIYRAPNALEQAIKEVEAGNIADPGRVASALNNAERMERSRKFGEKSVLSGTITKQYEKAIKERFTSQRLGQPAKVDEDGYGSALTEYHLALTEWEEANPKASAAERMKAQREIGKQLLEGLQTGAQQAPQGRPQAPTSGSPATPAPGQQSAAPPASPAVLAMAREMNPALKGMTDEQLQAHIASKRPAPAPAGSPSGQPPSQGGTGPGALGGSPQGPSTAAPSPAAPITPESIAQARQANPALANLPEPVLRQLMEKANAKSAQAAPKPADAAPPAAKPAPAPAPTPAPQRSPAPNADAPAQASPLGPAADEALRQVLDSDHAKAVREVLPPRLQQAVDRFSDAKAKSEQKFERIEGTPFAVPRSKAPEGPAPTTPPKKNTYKGATYEPKPGEKFEAPDLDIAYAAKPGTTYSKSATAKRQKVSAIVYHHTASPDSVPAKNMVEYGQKVDPVRGGAFGYHFYIDREGNIIQGAPLTARTNHVKHAGSGKRTAHQHISNENAIGISLVGTGKNPTPAQKEAARKLGEALVNKYAIDRKNVVGHGETQSDREKAEGAELARLLRGDQKA